MENLVYAIILLPLFGFLINGLFGKNLPKVVVGSIATLVVFASFCIVSYPFLVKVFGFSNTPIRLVHLLHMLLSTVRFFYLLHIAFFVQG